MMWFIVENIVRIVIGENSDNDRSCWFLFQQIVYDFMPNCYHQRFVLAQKAFSMVILVSFFYVLIYFLEFSSFKILIQKWSNFNTKASVFNQVKSFFNINIKKKKLWKFKAFFFKFEFTSTGDRKVTKVLQTITHLDFRYFSDEPKYEIFSPKIFHNFQNFPQNQKLEHEVNFSQLLSFFRV